MQPFSLSHQVVHHGMVPKIRQHGNFGLCFEEMEDIWRAMDPESTACILVEPSSIMVQTAIRDWSPGLVVEGTPSLGRSMSARPPSRPKSDESVAEEIARKREEKRQRILNIQEGWAETAKRAERGEDTRRMREDPRQMREDMRTRARKKLEKKHQDDLQDRAYSAQKWALEDELRGIRALRARDEVVFRRNNIPSDDKWRAKLVESQKLAQKRAQEREAEDLANLGSRIMAHIQQVQNRDKEKARLKAAREEELNKLKEAIRLERAAWEKRKGEADRLRREKYKANCDRHLARLKTRDALRKRMMESHGISEEGIDIYTPYAAVIRFTTALDHDAVEAGFERYYGHGKSNPHRITRNEDGSWEAAVVTPMGHNITTFHSAIVYVKRALESIYRHRETLQPILIKGVNYSIKFLSQEIRVRNRVSAPMFIEALKTVIPPEDGEGIGQYLGRCFHEGVIDQIEKLWLSSYKLGPFRK